MNLNPLYDQCVGVSVYCPKKSTYCNPKSNAGLMQKWDKPAVPTNPQALRDSVKQERQSDVFLLPRSCNNGFLYFNFFYSLNGNFVLSDYFIPKQL